jgi:hypothetical protein
LNLGEIVDQADLEKNLLENALPTNFAEVDASSYKEFLADRRKLMARKVREYYEQL